MGELDIPWEDQEPVDLQDDFLVCSGVVVMAATLPLPDETLQPCVVFRFALADGSGFAPPVLLALEPEGLLRLAGQVGQATRRAVEAAG